jgi:hypothetical protein
MRSQEATLRNCAHSRGEGEAATLSLRCNEDLQHTPLPRTEHPFPTPIGQDYLIGTHSPARWSRPVLPHRHSFNCTLEPLRWSRLVLPHRHSFNCTPEPLRWSRPVLNSSLIFAPYSHLTRKETCSRQDNFIIRSTTRLQEILTF